MQYVRHSATFSGSLQVCHLDCSLKRQIDLVLEDVRRPDNAGGCPLTSFDRNLVPRWSVIFPSRPLLGPRQTSDWVMRGLGPPHTAVCSAFGSSI